MTLRNPTTSAAPAGGSSAGGTSRQQCSPSQPLPCVGCLSQDETLLLSATGDLLSCRSRDSSYPPESSSMMTTAGMNHHNNKHRSTTRNGTMISELAEICCDDDLSTQLQDTTICGDWAAATTTSNNPSRGGLLGGSPAEVAPAPFYSTTSHLDNNPKLFYQRETSASTTNKNALRVSSITPSSARRAFRSPPLRNLGIRDGVTSFSYDEESILPIRSFDYSHFAEGGNDMLVSDSTNHNTSSRTNNTNATTTPTSSSRSRQQQTLLLHGVPTFLSSFRHIKVTQVSAHPLGSHVLAISTAGILYSYGLNDSGQLGIGIRSSSADNNNAYVMTPTIVTPLLQYGGKSILVAAGVNHSLVVVKTLEQRLLKQSSSSSLLDLDNKAQESVVYHQIYGFGRNDSMKIGLVDPKLDLSRKEDAECVLLPRRVALRCTIQASDDDAGVVCIRASAEHSAALLRRASGEVELYTWGNAMDGALGLTPLPLLPPPPLSTTLTAPSITMEPQEPQQQQQLHAVVPVPSFVSKLSRNYQLEARASSLLIHEQDEYPIDIALGRRSSFVVTSTGRCFSFGTSDEGMLGLGSSCTMVSEPTLVAMPSSAKLEAVVSISAGASHVLATTDRGRVFAWGHKLPAGLSSSNDNNDTNKKGKKKNSSSTSKEKEDKNNIQWTPKCVSILNAEDCTSSHKRIGNSDCRDGQDKQDAPELGENDDDDDVDNFDTTTPRIQQAIAGYDSTVFVEESGRVLTCGVQSGRLGLGEVREHVRSPRPMFGGLRLWCTNTTTATTTEPSSISSQQHYTMPPTTPAATAATATTPKSKNSSKKLKRGMTIA